MLKIIQRFGKHYSCHLLGKYVIVGCFWRPYIRKAVGGELGFMVLIGGAEERAAHPRKPNLYIEISRENLRANFKVFENKVLRRILFVCKKAKLKEDANAEVVLHIFSELHLSCILQQEYNTLFSKCDPCDSILLIEFPVANNHSFFNTQE
jgi:hypothetical protein